MATTCGRYVFLVGLCIVYVSLSNGDNCTDGRYGSQCQYECHCESTVACHPLSGCGGQCAEGWDGNTCQRQNVALRRNTSQSSSLFDDSRAVDGGLSFLAGRSCSSTNLDSNAEWHVSLDSVYNIFRFTIYNRDDGCCPDRLNGFVVSVGSSSTGGSPAYTECYRDTTIGVQGPGRKIKKTCTNGQITGNLVQIKLSSTGYLTLCEVFIYVCAFGWYDEMCDRECDKCLRCNSNQQYCEECIQGMWGTYCDQTCGKCWDERQCIKNSGVCPDDDPYTCAAGYQGNDCKQGCAEGQYGEDCLNSCGHCAGGMTTCATDSGVCPNISPRCKPGYKGDLCKQNCSSGEYGADCIGRCGQCAQVCSVDTGICSGSPTCKPGYRSARCITECDDGTYGSECLQTCGACEGGNSTCNHIDGTCPSCQPGWHGSLCKQGCAEGQYGEDCLKTCGHCAGGKAQCANDSGLCPNISPRCKTGFKGDLCKQTCPIGKWDVSCLGTCHCAIQSTCNSETGVCSSDGCETGWIGFNCQISLQKNQEECTGWTIAVGILATLLLVSTVAAIILFFLWRRSVKQVRKELHARYAVTKFDNTSKGDNQVYEELDG